jgi:hypothetical protein
MRVCAVAEDKQLTGLKGRVRDWWRGEYVGGRGLLRISNHLVAWAPAAQMKIMWRRLVWRLSGQPLSSRMGTSQSGQMGGLMGDHGLSDRTSGMVKAPSCLQAEVKPVSQSRMHSPSRLM